MKPSTQVKLDFSLSLSQSKSKLKANSTNQRFANLQLGFGGAQHVGERVSPLQLVHPSIAGRVDEQLESFQADDEPVVAFVQHLVDDHGVDGLLGDDFVRSDFNLAGLKDQHPVALLVDEAVLRDEDENRINVGFDFDVLVAPEIRAKRLFGGVEDVGAHARDGAHAAAEESQGLVRSV